MADPTQNPPVMPAPVPPAMQTVLMQGGRAVPPASPSSMQQLVQFGQQFPQAIPQPISFGVPPQYLPGSSPQLQALFNAPSAPGFVGRNAPGPGGLTMGGGSYSMPVPATPTTLAAAPPAAPDTPAGVGAASAPLATGAVSLATARQQAGEGMPLAPTPGAPAAAAAVPTAAPQGFGGDAVPVYRGMTAPGQAYAPDPAIAQQRGYDQQLSYARALMGGQNIQEVASHGDPRNYTARLEHLVGAMGQNDFGQVAGMGANAQTQASAGMIVASTAAGAQVYGHQAGLQGIEQTLKWDAEKQALTVQPGGQTTTQSAIGIPMTNTTYVRTYRDANNNIVTAPVGPEADRAAAAKPIPGKTYRDAAGNESVYQPDGTYKPVGK